MRIRVLAAIICVVALGLGGYIAYSKLPAHDYRDLSLTGVLKRKADVFAANQDGIYRATLASKSWTRLDTPPEMPLGGKFARQPEDSRDVYYLAPQPAWGAVSPSTTDPNAVPLQYGLYVSHDDGASWARIWDAPEIGQVLLKPDGTLFATTGGVGYKTSGVFRSADGGKTWRDITGPIIGSVMGLFDDPNHPGLVCVTTLGIQTYVAQADDERYEWKIHPESAWNRSHPDFFERQYSSCSTYYQLPASLANYFDHDFGNSTSREGMEILPDAEHFRFRKGQPVAVPVRIVLHEYFAAFRANLLRNAPAAPPPAAPAPSTEIIVDEVDATNFWSIRVEKDGKQLSRPMVDLATQSIPPDPAQDALRAKITAPGRLHRFPTSARSPYRRTIDLGRMVDFSKPGEYRVQLGYSYGAADPSKKEWCGHVDSPVFRVTIE